MKKASNYFQKAVTLYLLYLAITACTSGRQVSDYPYYSSFNQNEFDFHTHARKPHLKNKTLPLPGSGNMPLSFSENKTDVLSLPDSNQPKEFKNFISAKPLLMLTPDNQDRLTASLSAEPVVREYKFYPLANRQNNKPVVDTGYKKRAQTPDPATGNNQDIDAGKDKKGATYAYISLISAILSIVFLIAGGSFLIIPFSVAAIVFGVLGSKSGKRKIARTGLVMGIVLSVIAVAAFLYLVISGGYGM